MEVERSIRLECGARTTTRAARERAIAELAERQHGVVARRQLVELGFGRSGLARRLEASRLHRLYPGVYAVGHRVLTPDGRRMAAVLACGPGAVLSHRSAAALWALRAYSGPHEVAVASKRSPGPSVVARRLELRPDEVAEVDGLPVTTVARTLLDLAAVLDRHRLEQAVGEAEKRQLADSPSLPELIERHRGARGLAALRAILGRRDLGLNVPESELEVEFLAFLAERGLPRPEVNAWVAAGNRRYRVDCLWRERLLVVELDSRAHHNDPDSFERDRRRDTALLALGLRTARVTARRLTGDRDGLDRELRAALVP